MTQISELRNRITELELQAASGVGGLDLDGKLEARLRKAQKLESLAELAVGVAHDFNNFLVAIRGNAELALTALPPSSEARVFVERIEKASQRAGDLANQMLAYASKRPMSAERVDLNRLVREMTDLVQSAICHGVRLDLRLADDLPAIEADATQIRQVVMNLIKNAAEATGGDGTVSVSTRALDLRGDSQSGYRPIVFDPHGPYALLEVADTGRGMDRETQARLFDPFFTTKPEGHGLGLAAVLAIVRAHRGGIAVDSEPGKGTRFQVLLPAR